MRARLTAPIVARDEIRRRRHERAGDCLKAVNFQVSRKRGEADVRGSGGDEFVKTAGRVIPMSARLGLRDIDTDAMRSPY